MTRILYIIAHRAKNLDRTKNLAITLQWLKKVKNKISAKIDFDILVVEQDAVQQLSSQAGSYQNMFIFNAGTFNKGWAFNVAVKMHPNYDYYAFGDNDLVYPKIRNFINEIVKCCCTEKYPAFRPFELCLDTIQSDMSQYETFRQVRSAYNKNLLNVNSRQGINLAGGLIIISSQMLDHVGGWDEDFVGWGRHDDFMTHKLMKVGHCKEIQSQLKVIHLWHERTCDFQLNQDIVDLYNNMTAYTDQQLHDYISHIRLQNGNPDLYSK
jgi:GT2 family glycosyltransferase